MRVVDDAGSFEVRVVRLARGLQESVARIDVVAHEEPLQIVVNGVALSVLMRTPGHDEELGLGYLRTELVITELAQVTRIRHCSVVPEGGSEDNVLQIRLADAVPLDIARLRRSGFASASCGTCGKTSIEHACGTAPPVVDPVHFSAECILDMPGKLRARQATFALTGGLHAAALFDQEGDLLVVREDVGRHNAVDKVVGHALREGVSSACKALFVSGRISFEIVQKAAAARVPVLAGISAPTSLAVRAAEALGISLLGFVREPGMNVYTHGERIAWASPSAREGRRR